MNIHRRLLFLFFALSLLLSGCEFKDLDKRFFVVTIGIDQSPKNPDRLEVSFKTAIPTGTPKMGSEKFQVFTVESESISSAMQKIKSNVDKELDFGHAKALIIGEKLAKKDVTQAVDWFTRIRFIEEIGWVAVGKPSAKLVLDVEPKFERLPSNALFLSFGGTGVESQFIVSERLFAFYRDVYEHGVDPILPVINVAGDHFEIDHALAFKQSKGKVELTDKETRLFNMLDRRVTNADFDVPMDRGIYAVHVDDASVTYSIDTDPSGGTIHVKIKLGGNLEEREKKSIVTKQVLANVSRALEQSFSKDAKAFLQKMQKEDVDPLSFGLLYRSRKWDDYLTEMNTWKQLYPKIRFDVQTSAELQSSGVIK